MRHILFGSSTGFGVGDYENGGWATQLRLFIDRQEKREDHNLVNLCVSGDTTRSLLARLGQEAKLRIRDNPPQDFKFLIAIGGNDSRINKIEKEKNVSEQEFKLNLLKLIKITKKLCREIILIGLSPVYEPQTTPFKEQKYYYNERIEKYDQIIKNVAKDKNIKFVNIFSEFKNKDLAKLFADGLHPNTQGHKIIFEKVKKELFESNKVV